MTAESGTARRAWFPILPVPEDAPAPRLTHQVRGAPEQVFEIRDAASALLGYVCRFTTSRGDRLDLTYTWCRNAAGERAWRWTSFAPLRPLYAPEPLGTDLGRPVCVHFNLRAADVAREVFPEYLHVAFIGTLRTMDASDWSVLRGRDVTIWPPTDAATYKAPGPDPVHARLLPELEQPPMRRAKWLADVLRGYQCTPIIVSVPTASDALPRGWDCAMAVELGWTRERIVKWFDEHFVRSPAPAPLAGTAPRIDPDVATEDWARQLLRKDGSGPLLPELANVKLILTHHHAWRDVIYLDDFSHQVKLARHAPVDGMPAGAWRDVYDTFTAAWMAERMGVMKLKLPDVTRAVQAVAELNKRNPLQEYLRDLRWDGTPRLDEWVIGYLGAGYPESDEDKRDVAEAKARINAYLRIVGAKWLMGAVARGLYPGCKWQYVLILEGAQGLGKSSAIATLGAPWVLDTPISLADKEGLGLIQGKWMVEIPELDSFNRVESTTAKTFFSRSEDRFRTPYGRSWEDYPRTCVFAGTTNEGEYFKDTTGNRRYWPVRCRRAGFDLEGLARDRDQLLAEAVHRVLAGERVYPTPDEELQLLAPEQAKREILDPWQAVIADWLEGDEAPDGQAMRREAPTRVTMRQLLTDALKIERSRLDERSMTTRVGRIMRRLGWRKSEDKRVPDRFVYLPPARLNDETAARP